MSGFGTFSSFRLVLNTLHLRFVSGEFFASILLIFGHIQFSATTFSRVGLVTTRYETPDRGNIFLALLIQDGVVFSCVNIWDLRSLDHASLRA